MHLISKAILDHMVVDGKHVADDAMRAILRHTGFRDLAEEIESRSKYRGSLTYAIGLAMLAFERAGRATRSMETEAILSIGAGIRDSDGILVRADLLRDLEPNMWDAFEQFALACYQGGKWTEDMVSEAGGHFGGAFLALIIASYEPADFERAWHVLRSSERGADADFSSIARVFVQQWEQRSADSKKFSREFEHLVAALRLDATQNTTEVRRLTSLRRPPWEQPKMRLLRDLLVQAYGSPALARHLALTAGVDLRKWNEQQAPDPAWSDLLEVTMAQTKLSVLIARALEDPSIAAYHQELRTFLELQVETR